MQSQSHSFSWSHSSDILICCLHSLFSLSPAFVCSKFFLPLLFCTACCTSSMVPVGVLTGVCFAERSYLTCHPVFSLCLLITAKTTHTGRIRTGFHSETYWRKPGRRTGYGLLKNWKNHACMFLLFLCVFYPLLRSPDLFHLFTRFFPHNVLPIHIHLFSSGIKMTEPGLTAIYSI